MFDCKQINSTITPIVDDDIVYNDNKIKAAVFNYFLPRISSLENHKLHIPPVPLAVPFNFDRIIIYDFDVRDILTQLKFSEASGPDGINNKLLKEGAPFLTEHLKLLFTLSLQ